MFKRFRTWMILGTVLTVMGGGSVTYFANAKTQQAAACVNASAKVVKDRKVKNAKKTARTAKRCADVASLRR